MTSRRRWVLLLLLLFAAAAVVAAVVLAGGPPEEDPTGTSAFDPSVPTSTHTPPPAGGTTAPADPTDAPSDAPDGGADPSDPPTGTASPSAPSTPTPQQQAEISKETSSVLVSVLEQTAQIDPAVPSDVVGDLSDVATRSYLSELEAERLEFETEGWTRSGAYSFGEVEVLESSSTNDGEVATVRLCVDSSALVTQRADGEVIATSPSSTRAWNIFVLERSDSADWRIVGRTFPDDPAC